MSTVHRPTWMDDAFVRTCIIKCDQLPADSSVHLRDIHLSPVLARGQNFQCCLLRLNVRYDLGGALNVLDNEEVSKTQSFVLKIGAVEDHSNELNFDKETGMYKKFLPALENLLETVNIKTSLGCRCIYYALHTVHVLVLEDLKMQNYLLAHRHEGLDLQHCKCVLEKLAQMHAASMVYLNREGNVMDSAYFISLFENAFFKDSPELTKHINNVMMRLPQPAIDVLKSQGGHEKQVEYLEWLRSASIQTALTDAATHIPGNKFNALLHGDLWINNLMFKYAAEASGGANRAAPIDVKLVDLQAGLYGSVAVDFLYFFFSSVSNEVRQKHYEDLQRFYFDILVDVLRRLNYSSAVPTFAEFQQELKRNHVIAVYASVYLNIIVLADDVSDEGEDAGDLPDQQQIIDAVLAIQNGGRYFERLAISVDLMERNGYFDRRTISLTAPI